MSLVTSEGLPSGVSPLLANLESLGSSGGVNTFFLLFFCCFFFWLFEIGLGNPVIRKCSAGGSGSFDEPSSSAFDSALPSSSSSSLDSIYSL